MGFLLQVKNLNLFSISKYPLLKLENNFIYNFFWEFEVPYRANISSAYPLINAAIFIR